MERGGGRERGEKEGKRPAEGAPRHFSTKGAIVPPRPLSAGHIKGRGGGRGEPPKNAAEGGPVSEKTRRSPGRRHKGRPPHGSGPPSPGAGTARGASAGPGADGPGRAGVSPFPAPGAAAEPGGSGGAARPCLALPCLASPPSALPNGRGRSHTCGHPGPGNPPSLAELEEFIYNSITRVCKVSPFGECLV